MAESLKCPLKQSKFVDQIRSAQGGEFCGHEEVVKFDKCIRDECAWWVSEDQGRGEGRCAVLFVASEGVAALLGRSRYA